MVKKFLNIVENIIRNYPTKQDFIKNVENIVYPKSKTLIFRMFLPHPQLFGAY